MTVRYRHIDGHSGYRVGDDGSVWSCWEKRGRIAFMSEVWRELKSGKSGTSGHAMVQFRGKKSVLVHRLVLEAFVGKAPAGTECRHLDGNARNNRVENLVWGTRRQNCKDQIEHGVQVRGSRAGAAKLREEDIPTIMALAEQRMKYRDIGARFGVTEHAIRAIRLGKSWNHVTGLKQPASYLEAMERRNKTPRE